MTDLYSHSTLFGSTEDSIPGSLSLTSSKSPGLLSSSSSSSSSSSMAGSNPTRPQSSPILSGNAKSQPGYVKNDCSGACLTPLTSNTLFFPSQRIYVSFSLGPAGHGAADRGTAGVKAVSKAFRISWFLTAQWASSSLSSFSNHSGKWSDLVFLTFLTCFQRIVLILAPLHFLDCRVSSHLLPSRFLLISYKDKSSWATLQTLSCKRNLEANKCISDWVAASSPVQVTWLQSWKLKKSYCSDLHIFSPRL